MTSSTKFHSPQSYPIIARCSPYGSQQARAALDIALTAAAFEQPISVVFMDAGVLQLLKDQQADAGEMKNIGKIITALKLYEVENIVVHQEAVDKYDLDPTEFVEAVEVVTSADIKSLIAGADQVMVF